MSKYAVHTHFTSGALKVEALRVYRAALASGRRGTLMANAIVDSENDSNRTAW